MGIVLEKYSEEGHFFNKISGLRLKALLKMSCVTGIF